MKELAFKQYIEAELNAACQRRQSLIGYTLEQLEAKATDPPPYCEVDVGAEELIVNPFSITVTPISIDSPRRLQLEVSDGAYTSNTRYG
jgi:hypothetical protein